MKQVKLLLCMLLIALIAGCGTKQTTDVMEEAKKRGYLIMGLDDTFAPMGFRNDKNELVGFDIDLASEVSKRLGIKFQMQPIDWSMKESELNNKTIDLIWNGYSITEARKEQVAFTKPYLSNRQVIVVLADSAIQTKQDLAGKTVAVQKQSSALEAVLGDQNFADGLQGKAPIEFDTNLEAFMDLEAKRVEAIVVDEVLADYVIKQRNEHGYRYLAEDFGTEDYGIGVRKQDEALLEKIDAIMDELKADGTYDQIFDRWFARK